MNEKTVNRFDLPFQNPFQKKNETFRHFVARCDKSMLGIKQSAEAFLGSGNMYYYSEAYLAQKRNAKTYKRHTE
jgi:hypothetical protein